LFRSRYLQGEGLDGLELDTSREKGWMIWSYISRGRRVGWFGVIYPEGEELDGL